MTTNPIDATLPPCRSTLLSSLRACLAAADDHRDLAEVAGLTGLAFYLNVDRIVSPSGVAAYPWAQELPGMVSRLGYAVEIVYSDDEDPQFDRAQERAARVAANALTRGMPSMLFGVHLPEFGIVRGYDAHTRELTVSGVLDGAGGQARLPIDRLGRGDVPVLLLATLHSARADLDETRVRLTAIRHAVRRAAGLGPRLGGFTCGVRGYAVWHDALESGTIDPAGHAYTLHVIAELRAAAAPFLHRLGGAFDDAAASYAIAADRLVALSAATPFPLPEGFGFTSSARSEALDAIGAIGEAEARAVQAMELALDATRRTRAISALKITEAGPDDASALFRYADEMPLAELADAAQVERERVKPHIGGSFRAKIAREGRELVGALHYADLDDAGPPIDTDDGRYLYLYYVWVAREHRDTGIGSELMDALMETALDEGYRGIFADATDQEVYLYVPAFAALGFEMVDRTEDAALMYRAVRGAKPAATISAAPDAGDGPLRVVVAQHRPCPVVARTRENVIAAAQAAQERGARVDLVIRSTPPNEIVVGGRRLPLTYIPADAAALALEHAADAWDKR